MADKLLTGDGNWNTSLNWSPVDQPADADSAFVMATLGANVTMPDTQKAIDLAVLKVMQGYKHQVGSAGAPIEITATLMRILGGTGFYLKNIDDGSAAANVDRIEIQMPSASGRFELDGDASSSDGAFTRTVLLRGNGLIKSATKFTSSTGIVEVGYVLDRRNDVKVKIESTNTLPLLDIYAGSVDCRSTVTSVRVVGAKYKQDDRAAGTIHIFSGGECEYLWSAGTTIKVFGGGLLDMRKNTRLTVIDEVTAYPGSTVLRDEAVHDFTVFNDWRDRV